MQVARSLREEEPSLTLTLLEIGFWQRLMVMLLLLLSCLLMARFEVRPSTPVEGGTPAWRWVPSVRPAAPTERGGRDNRGGGTRGSSK